MRVRNKLLLGVFILLAAAAVAVIGRYCWLRYEYPYGMTHRCSRSLLLSLTFYADDHGGKYPAGEATPEASFSLLYREMKEPAEFLAGRAKTKEEVETAKKILESGGLLGPDTCDWRYVEGLDDNAPWGVALFWGKSDLGHVGQRLHGGHEVAFNGGHIEVIPASRWKEFLAEQERMVAEYLAEKKKDAEKGKP